MIPAMFLKHFKTCWILEKAIKTPNTHSERVIKYFSIDLQHQTELF